jgi:hypothetical protein
VNGSRARCTPRSSSHLFLDADIVVMVGVAGDSDDLNLETPE